MCYQECCITLNVCSICLVVERKRWRMRLYSLTGCCSCGLASVGCACSTIRTQHLVEPLFLCHFIRQSCGCQGTRVHHKTHEHPTQRRLWLPTLIRSFHILKVGELAFKIITKIGYPDANWSIAMRACETWGNAFGENELLFVKHETMIKVGW